MLNAGRIDAPTPGRDEDLLVSMLIAWTASVDTGPATPSGATPSGATAAGAVPLAPSRPPPARPRHPPRRSFVGAAAVLVAALAGFPRSRT